MAKSHRSRSKRKQAQQQENMQRILTWAVPVVLVAILAVGAIVLLGGDDSTDEQTASVELISPVEYTEMFSPGDDYVLLDVRTPEEFAGGHIEGAINIDHTEVAARIDEIPDDKPIVLYCNSGRRSALAADDLAAAGYDDLYDIDGGIEAWFGAGLPTVQ